MLTKSSILLNRDRQVISATVPIFVISPDLRSNSSTATTFAPREIPKHGVSDIKFCYIAPLGPEPDLSKLPTCVPPESLNCLTLKARNIGGDDSIVVLKYVLKKLRDCSMADRQSSIPLFNRPRAGDAPTIAQKLQHIRRGIELQNRTGM